MNSPDYPDVLALTLPGGPFSLDSILADLAQEVMPPQFPPAITGAAIWDDIWNAVEQLRSFLGWPGRILGWIYDNVVVRLWNRISDVWLWFWNALAAPLFQWVYNRIWDVWNWFWNNALAPSLGSIFNRVWDVWNWFWVNALSPTLGSIFNRVWDVWNWFWTNALQPTLGALWNRVQDVWQWFWTNALQPTLGALWNRVQDVWDWFWTNLLQPALQWLWGRLTEVGDRLGDFTEWFHADAWPVIQGIPETVINVGIQGAQAIGAGFEDALRWLFEHVFEPIASSIQTKLSIPRKLLTGQYTSGDQLLRDFEDPFPMGSVAGLALALPASILGLIGATSAIGEILYENVIQLAAKSGGYTIPSLTDLRDAYLRGLMPESRHDDWLGRAGYNPENINIIKQLYFEIPTPSDLVRMAVREAFTPEVVSRFGLHLDFPAPFDTYARQIGISHEWALAHWAAHWDLPSATQGFEMYHRGVISRDDLVLLLRTLDVMPFWRDRLINIAYRVISRIDVRRMYAHGVFNRDQVLRVYLDLGYKPEDAEALTEFVVRAATGTTKDLPRETIVGAYRDRLIPRDEALDRLTDLDFTLEEAELFLDMADYNLEAQNARLAEDIVEIDFKARAISEAAARSQLAQLGVPVARIDLLINLWNRQAARRTATLTTAQNLRLFREAIINTPTLRERLTALGYNETDIGYLIQLATPEEAAVEPRELTKADLRAAFREGIITEAELRDRLRRMGYTGPDVEILVALAAPA